MNSPDANSAEQLLASALASPFDREAIYSWFDCLAREFPLWSFQSWRYAELQSTGLPTNYPLQGLIHSICRHEELEPGIPVLLEPLPSLLDHLRTEIAKEGRDKPASVAATRTWAGESTQLRILTRESRSYFNCIYPMPIPWELWDPKDPEADLSQARFADIGQRLVRLLETRKYAEPGSANRRPAKRDLQTFLDDLGVNLSAHRPDTGPPKAILCELVDEGAALLAVCWNTLGTELGETAKQVLSQEGVTDPSQQQVWSRRLSLPVLSLPEIRALDPEIEKARTWGRRLDPPTPQRLAIWFLENRLGIPASSLARKAKGSNTAGFFKDRENPLLEFFPTVD